MMSDISLPLSLMHRLSTYAVWFEEIIDGKVRLGFAAKAFDNIFDIIFRVTKRLSSVISSSHLA